jgi:hypothetical protein
MTTIPHGFPELVQQLLAQGFVNRRGRPRTGQKPLGPELERRLGLSPRRVRQLLAAARTPPGSKPAQAMSGAAIAVKESLRRALGTKVDFEHSGGVGRIVVHFSGYEHLDDLLKRLGAA